mmetsp:Transcript_141666/g.353223  ORF Transcript_141666/g.353223 Transcript_141666/m.353223 type:complete len:232 (+) Transcript_141666:595-1290(+)
MRSEAMSEQALAKSTSWASLVSRPRKAVNNLVSNLGIRECSLLSASRTECTHPTKVCVSGRLRCTMSVMRVQRSCTAVLTNPSSAACASNPPPSPPAEFSSPEPRRASCSLLKPSTASATSATYVLPAASHASRRASSAPTATPPSKQRPSVARSAAARPPRKSPATRAESSPRSRRVTELFTASAAESSGERSLDSRAVRMRPICSSTSSSTARNVLTCLYRRRKTTQAQ